MKRRTLLAHLRRHGCQLTPEGAKHSIYSNPATGATSTVPRHTEIADLLILKIWKDLGIPAP
jgi:mRNA interferase HicA